MGECETQLKQKRFLVSLFVFWGGGEESGGDGGGRAVIAL